MVYKLNQCAPQMREIQATPLSCESLLQFVIVETKAVTFTETMVTLPQKIIDNHMTTECKPCAVQQCCTRASRSVLLRAAFERLTAELQQQL